MTEQPLNSHDDELDVEELEEVAGGSPALGDNEVGNSGCPTNVNCPCIS